MKGKLPPSIAAMLAGVGLVEGTDYDTVPVEGFDPTRTSRSRRSSGSPATRATNRASSSGPASTSTCSTRPSTTCPGRSACSTRTGRSSPSTRRRRRTSCGPRWRGLADAIADPAAASAIAIDLINGNGNPNFLSPEGETFRWETESKLIVDTTPDGTPIGVPDPAVLQKELDTYAEVGLFGDGETPQAEDSIDASIIASIYAEDGSIIWPGQ